MEATIKLRDKSLEVVKDLKFATVIDIDGKEETVKDFSAFVINAHSNYSFVGEGRTLAVHGSDILTATIDA